MASAPVSPAARRHAKVIFHRLAVLITTRVLATVGVSIPAVADTPTYHDAVRTGKRPPPLSARSPAHERSGR
jgi:hypothetical protein